MAVSLSTEELLSRALDSSFEAETNDSWDAVLALGSRAGNEVLQSTKHLFASADPWHRATGANILGKFMRGVNAEERFELLSAALQREEEERTLDALIISIAHLHNPRSLSLLMRFVDHAHRRVRYAVAFAVEAGWGEAASLTLRKLCEDEWEVVRDWATFKFRDCDVDSPAIRQCLYARLLDSDAATRAEAICALARRQDLRCLKQLIEELPTLDTIEIDGICHIQAARYFVGATADDERSPEELRDELKRRYS